MTKPFSIVVAAWMAVLGLSIIGNKEQGAAAFSVSPKINQRPQRILNAIKPKSDHLLMPEDDFLRSNDGAAVDRRAKAATFLGGNNNRQTAEGMAMLFPKAMMLTLWSFMVPILASAVSGGGLDFANMDITGQDFSNGSYKGKDFTQVIAKTTNFRGSNLQGCRFYKAYLVRTDFTNADLRGASLEDTSMDEASLRNALASGAYFSASIMDAKDLENADFTDAQFPAKTLALLCSRDDVKGTNPTTGADTRESLMCP